MAFRHGTPLHIQVAERARRLIGQVGIGECLPADGKLASRWNVSVRTIREALLLLEAEGLVERRRGSGTWVCEPPRLPVALYCELNLLHPATPRFFGLVLDLVRKQLGEHGYVTRLYTGRSQAGDESGTSCPELIEDAEAGALSGIVAMTSKLREPRLVALRKQGLPMVSTGDPLIASSQKTGTYLMPSLAVPYLLEHGRRKIAMIGWQDATDGDGQPLVDAFRETLQAHGVEFRREWCGVDLSFGWNGSGWEEFREIWFAHEEKPDALLITDENFLPEVMMSILQLHLSVPQELLIVSHQSRGIPWNLPVPVARLEQDSFGFAERLTAAAMAALRGESAPRPSHDIQPYQLFPITGLAPQSIQPKTLIGISTP